MRPSLVLITASSAVIATPAVELLMVGGFSPLRGFMGEEDYRSVVESNRTTSGLLFGLPIVMDTDRDDIAVGQRLLLTYQGRNLAVMTVESKWEPDKAREALGCYGTSSLEHPAVRMIATERGRFSVSYTHLTLPTKRIV